MKQIKHIAKPFCALALLGTLPFASAAGIPAKSSIYPLYINGVRANTTGWLIHGNNYFKLRDIGKLINFSVIYDSNINAIKIETSAGVYPGINRNRRGSKCRTDRRNRNPYASNGLCKRATDKTGRLCN